MELAVKNAFSNPNESFSISDYINNEQIFKVADSPLLIEDGITFNELSY
jgi:hypothetical protein